MVPDKHIVDILIEERAERLHSRPIIWWLVRRFFFPIIRYRTAVRMVDSVQNRSGWGTMDWVVKLLKLNITVEGLENIPKTGPVIITPNHPTGIVDGIALYAALKKVRPDMAFFANRDAIRAAPGLKDLMIPVEWVVDKRNHGKSRETLASAVSMFREGRAVVLFASGRLAYRKGDRLIEREWLATPLTFARKFDCPLLPLHIEARNSRLYYILAKINEELKNMTLFAEMLNKQGKPYHLTFAPMVSVADLPKDPDRAIAALQNYVEHDLTSGKTLATLKPADAA